MREQIHPLEKDVTQAFKGTIWNKYIKALKQFSLVEDGDKVMVACSGGKDSLLLATLFKALNKHPLVTFEYVVVMMDPGYPIALQKHARQEAEALGLNLHVEQTTVFDVVQARAPEHPCFLCARIRRGVLYRIAREHGCNKIALGHHYDDVIETTMLNMLFSGAVKTMLPKVMSKAHPGMTLIRPLYFIREATISALMAKHGFNPIQCGCPLGQKDVSAKRAQVKQWLKTLNEAHPGIDASIFRAPDKVNLNYVLGWEKDGKTFRFDE